MQYTILEKNIMLECDHPFLIGLDYYFSNEERLFFIMPFIDGAELYKVFKLQKCFPEEVIKFYGAQIILGIGYLHARKFMHRDLKQENILIG